MRRHAPSTYRFTSECWANDLEKLRTVAAAKLKAEQLQWWWVKKYNRPLKDPLLQEYTIEELQVEYLMYLIEEDPQAAYPSNNGEIQFRTGDALVDKWEEQIAHGKQVDFDEGVDAEFLARFKKFSKRVAATHYPKLRENEEPKQSEPAEDVDLSDILDDIGSGFDDDYTKG